MREGHEESRGGGVKMEEIVQFISIKSWTAALTMAHWLSGCVAHFERLFTSVISLYRHD